LAALLYDGHARTALRAGEVADARFAALDPAELDEIACRVRCLVRGRTHRGTGDLSNWYPRTLAAWVTAHPADDSLDGLLIRFCASDACRRWQEGPAGAGALSLEEALYRFFNVENIGEAAVREEELLAAVVRSLAVTPTATFAWPASVHPLPRGCYAVTSDNVLHAAVDGRYLRGPITPLVAALLAGTPAGEAAVHFGTTPEEARQVAATLAAVLGG
jgi:hypothetical protein